MSYLLPKCEEYKNWGVPNIWVIDPEARKLFVFDGDRLREADSFTLSQYSVVLKASDVY